jgi:ubiquinone/menaquinone biosynthesis C-methylase UbiE
MRLCPSYLSFILYNPIRKALTDRGRVLDESGINESSVVLEIGAGNGFITEAIAQRAQKVYAVDVQEGMIRKLKKRMRKFGEKADIILCDIAVCGIGDGLADIVIMYYSFHEISDQPGAIENIRKALKAGGSVSIYEPTIEINRESMDKTVGMFENAGLKTEVRRDGLFTRFARLKKTR